MDSCSSGRLPKISRAIPEIQSFETDDIDEPPSTKPRAGEVTKIRESPFAGGAYCEVWEGQRVKQDGEVEKVSPSSLLLSC